jgi:hypothetical protein
VADEKQRHTEPERDSERLHWRHPQRAPLVDRDERERDMDRRCAIQQRGAGPAMPDGDGDAQSALRDSD